MSRAVTFAALALSIVYLGLILVLPVSAFHEEAEGELWLRVDSLWRQRWTSLAIDPPGAGFDPEGWLAPASLVRENDGIRSRRPAALPILASFPYAILGTRGIYLVPAAFSILCLAAADRLGRVLVPAHGPWRGIAAVAAIVATPVLLHGAIFCAHSMATALVTAGLVPPSKWIAGRLGAGPPVPAPKAWLVGGALILLGIGVASEPGDTGGSILMAAAPGILIGATGLIVRRRGSRGATLALVALLAALGTGAAAQLLGLREAAASRAARAVHASALQAAVPEGCVILADRREIPHLLATLSPARPVLYLRPGTDLAYLDRLMDGAPAPSFVLLDPGSETSTRWGEAILPRTWRETGPVASVGGLSLFRRDSRQVEKGYSSVPKGD